MNVGIHVSMEKVPIIRTVNWKYLNNPSNLFFSSTIIFLLESLKNFVFRVYF